MPSDLTANTADAHRLIHQALAKGATQLDTYEVQTILLACRPYPQELEESIALKDGSQCLCRPILPEDEPALKHFIDRVPKEDLYYRYFSYINEFTHDDLANITQIDYDREKAFVAVRGEEIIGVMRSMSDPDNTDAEFAVLVRSDLKELGLGRQLLEKIIDYARAHGLHRLIGITMPNNRGMIKLAQQRLDFDIDVQLRMASSI